MQYARWLAKIYRSFFVSGKNARAKNIQLYNYIHFLQTVGRFDRKATSPTRVRSSVIHSLQVASLFLLGILCFMFFLQCEFYCITDLLKSKNFDFYLRL